MKYTRLTKEQLESLHQEFSMFLAAQSIDKIQWDQIKASQPDVAEQILDVFSDVVWEGVLEKAQYLESHATQQLFLFHLASENMQVIIIKTEASINFTTQEGRQWLQEHLEGEEVELLSGTRNYSAHKKQDIFQLIQQGAFISKGELYQQLQPFVDQKK